ncbi:C25 family cysteine peptidase [Spirosoma sp. SC4-14]|uniref:putative type IX secretion system sortase PorU2 n=1 Tax=Spirosoma sp. SC4-14 TaxID=3128900 RepID=UPI0030CDECD5
MKNWVLLACFLVHPLAIYAQNRFGNEWIRPNQHYIKLSINQAGVYRVTYQDIQQADATLLQTNPTNWQLFFRGQEVAIRLVGQQDGRFDSQDYVEFYAEGNDGSQDSLLYRPQKRLHPYQTLFSDVAAYFLTSSPTQSGRRVAELNLSAQNLTAEPYHIEERVQAFTSDYTFNNLKGLEPYIQESYFEPGEGWSGHNLTADSIGIVRFVFTGRVSTNIPITLEGMVNGRDNNPHQIQIQQDNNTTTPLANLSFSGFNSQTFQSTLPTTDIQNEQLTLHFVPAKPVSFYPTNNFSVTYVKLSYPQATDMTGQTSKLFHLPAGTRQTALLAVTNAPTTAFAYDITDKANCRYLTTQLSGNQKQVVVSDLGRNRNILITDQVAKPLAIQSIRFPASYPKNTTYLLITHASLKQSAITYAAYRTSAQGGGYQTFIADADSLYDQFNYGERSPLALRRFADFMLANSSVQHLLLVGRACSYPYLVKTTSNDLVPTIGYPGSDILLTAGLNGYSINTPAIPTGRLNVTTNEQVLTYLEKAKQFENSTPNGLWRKRIIHISGGKSKDEAQSLRTALANLGTVFSNGLVGGEISAYSKNNAYEEVEPLNITPEVNEGVGVITFFGHAGPAVTDMNFGFASPVENGYRNTKYPLMVFNGCGVGEIFSNFNTLSTDWILAPNKGATLVLAHSYLSFEQPTTRYLNELYAHLYTDASTLGMPFGKVQQQINQSLDKVVNNDSYLTSVMLEMVLQGDPALRVYPLPNPDYAIEDKGIYIQSSVTGSAIKNSDSIEVVIPLRNLGKFVAGQSVAVSETRTFTTGGTSTTLHFTAFHYQDTLVYTIAKDPNLKQIDIAIDPTNQLTELDKSNNKATLAIDWTTAEMGTSYPLDALPDNVSPTLNVFINGSIKENKAVVNTTPRIDVYLLDENPLSATDQDAVEVYIKTCDSCAQQRVPSENITFTPLATNQLQATATLSFQAGSTYQLLVIGKDGSGNRTIPPYTITLKTLGSDEPVVVNTYPNPATTYTKFEIILNREELPTESKLTIYTASGAQLFEHILPVATGNNSFLWQGTAPGLYPYSIHLTWPDGRIETYTGKIVWQP